MAGPGRVVVVGGGVIGVCVAYELARRGADVVLLERDRLGAGASSGNAGTVSAGHPPLNRPGRVRRALMQMADPTSPLYIKPRWDPALWRWLADFARHCTDAHVASCMEVMAPLGKEALRLFAEIVGEERITCGYRQDGYFDACRTERGWSEARHEASMIAAHGYHPEVLDGRALRELEPVLAPDIVGGIFYPEAGTLNPHQFVLGVAGAARARGATIREGEGVVDVTMEGGAARGVRLASGEMLGCDAVVLATGPFSLALARRLGTRLPVQPGKGYHRDLSVGHGGAPKLRVAGVLNETSVFCTPMDGFVRFAGTMEFSGLNHVMRRPRLEQLTRAAADYLPGLEVRVPLSEWCGLRPVASDGLPIVGPLPGVPSVVAATGHGMLGLTLGPVTGALVADWVLEGTTRPLWRRLAPQRTSTTRRRGFRNSITRT
ncbi:MAG TPA: FAD-dependent oxidoreductase [Longimicrobiales bacterium]|nr:FAD-dependent oxidoreductase [Longimicrobiales bacterium]